MIKVGLLVLHDVSNLPPSGALSVIVRGKNALTVVLIQTKTLEKLRSSFNMSKNVNYSGLEVRPGKKSRPKVSETEPDETETTG